MNRILIEQYIPTAYKVLKNNPEIYVNEKISGTLKGNIASFGAAIQMGNLLSAVAFFNQQGGAAEKRQELLHVILDILKEHGDAPGTCTTLFDYICDMGEREMPKAKQLVVCAAVAVKLAMNLFEPEKKAEKSRIEVRTEEAEGE